MHKFNSTGILTGYIKQLLASFNLPKARIYTRAHAEYFEKTGKERSDILKTYALGAERFNSIHYVPYIKEGKFQEYLVDGDGNAEWKPVGVRVENTHVHYYDRGMKLLNGTRNLEIKNNIYDSYTHEYLGDYLRFKRDYDNINLMPLYNCFSNRYCANLDLSFPSVNGQPVEFQTADTRYKLFAMPVKLFQQYTIAIDSDFPIEFCCGIYSTRLDSREKFKDLPKLTYKRLANSQFSQPFLYTALSEIAIESKTNTTDTEIDRNSLLVDLAQNESDLKLFIKLPINNTSSITILEGDYRNWSDYSIYIQEDPNKLTKRLVRKSNISIISDEAIKRGADIPLVSPLQLLRMNTQVQVPFADRLIEYLLGNCILDEEGVSSQDILRVQKVVELNFNTTEKRKIYSTNYEGLWSNSLRNIIYQYMTTNYNTFNSYHDLLGYVDKDVERLYSAPLPGTDGKGSNRVSIMNAEILEEDK